MMGNKTSNAAAQFTGYAVLSHAYNIKIFRNAWHLS